MSLFDLSGKVALITGGNGGIGLGIATALAQAGAAVVIGARNTDKLARARENLEALGARVAAVALDVTERAALDGAVALAVERFGRLDILVANAGTNVRNAPEDYSEKSGARCSRRTSTRRSSAPRRRTRRSSAQAAARSSPSAR